MSEFTARAEVPSATFSLSNRIVAPLLAALLGIAVVGAVGFAHSQTIHDAAHDTRHAAAFPCH